VLKKGGGLGGKFPSLLEQNGFGRGGVFWVQNLHKKVLFSWFFC